jgi:SOS-response transcriptional repressor LexA
VKASLTRVEKAVLDAVRELMVDGLAPTYDEIAAHLGLRSRGQIAGHLYALRRKGRIEFGRQSRSIRIIEDDQPSEAEIRTASAVRLRGVIEEAADALADQIGQVATVDILALVLENRRKLARIENGGAPSSPRRQPNRFSRKSD